MLNNTPHSSVRRCLMVWRGRKKGVGLSIVNNVEEVAQSIVTKEYTRKEEMGCGKPCADNT